jgi:hypothetical protein
MPPRYSQFKLLHATHDTMLNEIKQVIRIVREEAGRRRWVSALRVLAAVISFIGVSIIALDPLLKWLFPSSAVAAWVIIVTLAVVIVLLVAIKFMLTYYERAIGETRGEWDRRTPVLKKLYALRIKGEQLRQLCEKRSKVSEPLSDDEQRLVRNWHEQAARHLEDRLGIEYRRRFYDHSPTGGTAPTAPSDCANWIYERLHVLKKVVDELRTPPPRLISEAELQQFHEHGYLTGRVYDDED